MQKAMPTPLSASFPALDGCAAQSRLSLPCEHDSHRATLLSGLSNPAQIYVHAQLRKHRSLGRQRLVGHLRRWSIRHIHVVRLVPCHQLVLAHSMQNRVHNRPLSRRFFPATLCFRRWQTHHRPAAQVRMERSALNKYATPHDLARLADSLQRTASQGKIHGWLPLAGGACISTNKMIRRRRTGNLQQPYKCVQTFALVMLSPANVVECSRRVKSKRFPAAIGNQRVGPGALVHFVEVHYRPAGKEFFLRDRKSVV